MTSPRPRPRRAARSRIVSSSSPAELADVDRERDHLDAPLLARSSARRPTCRAHPSTRARLAWASTVLSARLSRVSASDAGAQAGEPGELGGHLRAAGRFGAHDEHRVVTGDGAEHVRAGRPVERGADDVRAARRRAQHDEVARCARPRRRTRPCSRLRWSSGGARSLACSGIAYAIAPPGMRTFTAPSSSRSRLTVAWVATTPSASSSCTSWAWLDDRLLLEDAQDAVLTLGLAERRHRRPSPLRRLPTGPTSSTPSRARTLCMRFAACCHTTDRGPSITSAATSSPRCAGRQCRNTAPAGRRPSSARRRPCKPTNARSRCSRSSSWPIDVQTSV